MLSQKLSKNEIMNNIELTRKEMIKDGSIFGLTNPKTIKTSERLDQLLNIYQTYCNQERLS